MYSYSLHLLITSGADKRRHDVAVTANRAGDNMELLFTRISPHSLTDDQVSCGGQSTMSPCCTKTGDVVLSKELIIYINKYSAVHTTEYDTNWYAHSKTDR